MDKVILLYRHLLRELKKHYPNPQVYKHIKQEMRYSFQTTNNDINTGYQVLKLLRDFRYKNSWPW